MLSYKADKVVVHYQCPECKHIHNFKLKDCPGNTTFVCDECNPPEDSKKIYEPYPEVIGISITELE